LFGFAILFLLVSIFGLEKLMKPGAGGGSVVEYKPGFAPKTVEQSLENGTTQDEESGTPGSEQSSDGTITAKEEIQPHHSIYTWEEVNYTVSVKGGKRQLLTEVNGYVKPGRLTALMGASGAGEMSEHDPAATMSTDTLLSSRQNDAAHSAVSAAANSHRSLLDGWQAVATRFSASCRLL
jgi:hypothetical protein